MIRSIKRFLDTQLGLIGAPDTPADQAEHGYRLATAALLLEMTRADFEVKPEENAAVLAAIRRAFALNDAETDALLSLAEGEIERATSLHEFTSTLNAALSREQKCHVIELLWTVAFADGELDKYEDYLVRKVADLLYVRHSDFIKAKLTAQVASAQSVAS